MNRLFIIFLVLLMPLCALAATTATIHGIKYTLNDDGTAYVAEQKTLSGDIVIPEIVTYNGTVYTVTKLASAAFRNTIITSINLPESIITIGGSCFRNCSKLTSITIPERVTSLGDYCFQGCSNLTSITIPENVTSLGIYCFQGCSNLATITIPESVTSLGANCFSNCKALTRIELPKYIYTIPAKCFYGCTSLEYISFYATKLGDSQSFENCTGLKTIVSYSKTVPTHFGLFSDSDQILRYNKFFNGVKGSNVDLYVPSEAIPAYSTDDVWGEFNIKGLEELRSNDSKLYSEDFSLSKGATKTIDICLDNPDYEPTSIQFDIYMPEGVTVGQDGVKGTSRIPEGAYVNGNWVDSDKDGTKDFYRVLFFNMGNKSVSGTSGAVFTLSVTTTDAWDPANAPYTISFKNIKQDKLGETAPVYKIDNSNVLVYAAKTLAEILEGDNEGKLQYVADDLQLVKKLDETTLLLKDNGNSISKVTPDDDELTTYNITAVDTDFGRGITKNTTAQVDYDQSNWLMLTVDKNIAATVNENDTIEGGSISGVLTNKFNPAMTLTAKSLKSKSAGDEYVRNAMAPANFVGSQTGNDGNKYFFMTPKNNELVQVVWAVYLDGKFYCPMTSAGVNELSFAGIIDDLCYDYNGGGESTLQNGYAYQFTAIVKGKESTAAVSTPHKASNNRTFEVQPYNGTSKYTVYPLNLTHVETIVTSVDGVDAAREVAGIQYYNLQGQQFDSLQPGMNIVVTRYTDGTTTSVKIMN